MSSSSGGSGGGNVAVVREIYDSENAEETFEQDLDRALEIGYEVIIIEPGRLGEETARWIRVGNCLHTCAVVFGVSSICLSVTCNRNTNTFVIPLSIGSVFCAGLYMISWQFDPCCKYQVASNDEVLKIKSMTGASDSIFRERDISEFKLAARVATATSPSNINVAIAAPTILVRKNDTRRKIIHSAVASVAFTLAIIRFCY